mmetsp:Transcript_7247/g.19790  ORF Transcript_7247/g.19790 Transcript_7247/m.19790 type:complete len:252 (+) Transcript_7247:200-955(+)
MSSSTSAIADPCRVLGGRNSLRSPSEAGQRGRIERIPVSHASMAARTSAPVMPSIAVGAVPWLPISWPAAAASLKTPPCSRVPLSMMAKNVAWTSSSRSTCSSSATPAGSSPTASSSVRATCLPAAPLGRAARRTRAMPGSSPTSGAKLRAPRPWTRHQIALEGAQSDGLMPTRRRVHSPSPADARLMSRPTAREQTSAAQRTHACGKQPRGDRSMRTRAAGSAVNSEAQAPAGGPRDPTVSGRVARCPRL